MDKDFRELKQMLDTTIDMENRCFLEISQVLSRENERIQNPVIARVACMLEKFPNTPPEDVLRELNGLPKT